MGKLKIEHGVSRIKRAKLQTYIDQTVAEDIALMAEWTNNEQHYVVNELLRFALAQSEDFHKFKVERGTKDTKRTPAISTTARDPTLSLAKPSATKSAAAIGQTSQDK